MKDVKSILLDNIYSDEDFYPRKEVNQKKVNEYIEALKAGKVFPPITLQKVIYSEEGLVEKLVLIDGAHRREAYKKFNNWLKSDKHSEEESEVFKPIENISYVLHSDKVYSKNSPQDTSELLLTAAEYNSEHGYQMSNEDKQRTARAIYTLEPNQVDAEVAKVLGVPRSTLNDWVRDIKQKHTASQEAIITRLNLLGWAQENIGEVVGLTQQGVALNIQEMTKSAKLVQSLKDLTDRGKSVDEASEDLEIDRVLAWALLLKEDDDINKLARLTDKNKGLDCKPRPYDVWNFGNSYPLFGTTDYPGQIPGQIILQLLYFFTNQGDMVIDPMAGGGTTIDACLVMGRKCLAFDSEPETCNARVDIRQKDALEAIEGLTRKPDMIFLDPPYYKKMDRDYGEHSVSKLERNEYLDFFKKLAQIAHTKLPRRGRVALLMSDYTDNTDHTDNTDINPAEEIFIHQYISIFEDAGFRVERIISCPLSTDQIHADTINKFRESKKLARLARYLVIFNAT
jgi:DNA modification methylase